MSPRHLNAPSWLPPPRSLSDVNTIPSFENPLSYHRPSTFSTPSSATALSSSRSSSLPFSSDASPSRFGTETLRAPRRDRIWTQIVTALRVGVPSILAGCLAFASFPALVLTLARGFNDAKVAAVLSQDASNFVGNFLSLIGLLYSILVGQVFGFLYSQKEALYLALFDEVTEAKSLLEQVALVSQGRTMYGTCLASIARYVREDLRGGMKVEPSVLLSARPADDPLEAILYMTSVGVPGRVYDTVRTLRDARAKRLGALQRKVPVVHLALLWVLAGIMLLSFPLLGVGTQTIGGYNVLTVEGTLFGVAAFALVMTKMVLAELWRPTGGAYSVDSVLRVMVRGLEMELEERMAGARQVMKRSKQKE